MRKPKSCDGCKALYQNLWRHTCELGFELESKKKGSFFGVDILRIYPKYGLCPKPRTLTEFVRCFPTHAGGKAAAKRAAGDKTF